MSVESLAMGTVDLVADEVFLALAILRFKFNFLKE